LQSKPQKEIQIVSTPTLLLEEKCGELGTFSKPHVIGKAQPFLLLPRSGGAACLPLVPPLMPRTIVLEKMSSRKFLKRQNCKS